MSKSKTKELERLAKLRKQGVISNKDYQKLYKETLSGNKNPGCADVFKGGIFIIIALLWGIGIFINDDNKSDTKPTSQQTTLTQKQCDQIWKDEGYYTVLRDNCLLVKDANPIYRNAISYNADQFKKYADQHNCAYTEDKATKISNETRSVIFRKSQESLEKSGSLSDFCESEKTYFSKIIKKYGIN